MQNTPGILKMMNIIQQAFRGLSLLEYILFWTTISAIPIALVGFLGILFLRQLRKIQLHSTVITLIDRLERPGTLNQLTTLYHEYIRESRTPERIKQNEGEVHKLLNKFNRIGTLVYHDLIPPEIVLDLFPQTILRLWIMFEEYIRHVRRLRSGYMFPLQYFAWINLEYWLAQNPNGALIFFDDSDPRKEKHFDVTNLRSVLARMEGDIQLQSYINHSKVRARYVAKLTRRRSWKTLWGLFSRST